MAYKGLGIAGRRGGRYRRRGRGDAVAARPAGPGAGTRSRKGSGALAGGRRRSLSGVAGDAMDVRAAWPRPQRSASLIVHAVNPPGYRDWQTLVLPMLESTIAAARASGARILLPGTVYNYGPDVPRLDPRGRRRGAAPDHPQGQDSRSDGKRACARSRTRASCSLVVRQAISSGRIAGNNWFAQGIGRAPGRVPSSIAYPGTRGVGHQWAYLPDVAETMARLVEREDALDAFETFHMDGHWDGDGTMMTGAIQRVYGESASKLGRFPWWLIRLAQPFVPMFREIMEMRYLWQVPLRLSNARLVALLGNEPHTPLDRAVQATLAGQGCLPGGSAGVQGVLTSRHTCAACRYVARPRIRLAPGYTQQRAEMVVSRPNPRT